MAPEQWMEWSSRHKFLVLRPSDWRDFQSNSATLSPAEYEDMRRVIGRGMKRKAGRLYREARAVVLAPRIPDTTLEGVHLARKSQRILNKEMVQGVGRLLCADCRLPEEFFLRAYKRILDGTICHLKPPVPQMSEAMALVTAVALTAAPQEQKRKKQKTSKKVTFKEEIVYIE